MRSLAVVAAVVIALEIVKWTLGPAVALFIAAVVLALCVGILYGAGAKATGTGEPS